MVESFFGVKVKLFFMKEKYVFIINCLVWEDVIMIIGCYFVMIIVGSVMMGKNL